MPADVSPHPGADAEALLPRALVIGAADAPGDLILATRALVALLPLRVADDTKDTGGIDGFIDLVVAIGAPPPDTLAALQFRDRRAVPLLVVITDDVVESPNLAAAVRVADQVGAVPSAADSARATPLHAPVLIDAAFDARVGSSTDAPAVWRSALTLATEHCARFTDEYRSEHS